MATASIVLPTNATHRSVERYKQREERESLEFQNLGAECLAAFWQVGITRGCCF